MQPYRPENTHTNINNWLSLNPITGIISSLKMKVS